jgi:TPR repeat protein
MYENGDGVIQDTIEAMECYRRAAKLGHEDAEARLGVVTGIVHAVIYRKVYSTYLIPPPLFFFFFTCPQTVNLLLLCVYWCVLHIARGSDGGSESSGALLASDWIQRVIVYGDLL